MTASVPDTRALRDGKAWQNLDAAVLKQRLDAEACAVVEFWTPDCVFSRLMLPLRLHLTERFAGRVGLYRCHAWADDDPSYETWGVKAVPAVLLFRRGRPVRRWFGETPACLVAQTVDATLTAALGGAQRAAAAAFQPP